MNEKPILFSGPMVRAILEGRKTVTRRVVKPQPVERTPGNGWYDWGYKLGAQKSTSPRSCFWHADTWAKTGSHPIDEYCPYGQDGDRLWVRETWLYSDHWPPPDVYSPSDLHYRASATPEDLKWLEGDGFKWRPSIFMPRWASRITLEVTDIRVERLQSISEESAIAEGLTQWTAESGTIHYGESIADVWETKAAAAYARLWDTINAKRGFAWAGNPYVWVVEFKPL